MELSGRDALKYIHKLMNLLKSRIQIMVNPDDYADYFIKNDKTLEIIKELKFNDFMIKDMDKINQDNIVIFSDNIYNQFYDNITKSDVRLSYGFYTSYKKTIETIYMGFSSHETYYAFFSFSKENIINLTINDFLININFKLDDFDLDVNQFILTYCDENISFELPRYFDLNLAISKWSLE